MPLKFVNATVADDEDVGSEPASLDPPPDLDDNAETVFAVSEDDDLEDSEISIESDSDSEFDEPDEELTPEEARLLEILDLITAFSSINPDPTDEEFHSLAIALRMEPQALEESVFRLQSVMFSDDESALKDEIRDMVSEPSDESDEMDQALVESSRDMQYPVPFTPAEGEVDGEVDTEPRNT